MERNPVERVQESLADIKYALIEIMPDSTKPSGLKFLMEWVDLQLSRLSAGYPDCDDVPTVPAILVRNHLHAWAKYHQKQYGYPVNCSARDLYDVKRPDDNPMWPEVCSTAHELMAACDTAEELPF
jgi:hypothetical protein